MGKFSGLKVEEGEQTPEIEAMEMEKKGERDMSSRVKMLA